MLANSIKDIPMPDRLQRLPLTDKGYPTLFFAAIIDNKPNIRVVDLSKFKRCMSEKLCWLCGELLEEKATFVITEELSNIKQAIEPPCHLECAEYAMKACPFITNPEMKYHNKNYNVRPDKYILYTTTSYQLKPRLNRWPSPNIILGPECNECN